MRVIYGIGNLAKGPKTPKVIAVGVFDGVHRGHQMILRRVAREAKKKKRCAAVLTFVFHPSCRPIPSQMVPHLTSLEEKLFLIAKQGIDCCYVLCFNAAFSAIPAEHFVEALLIKKLKMVALYIGDDFVFGQGANGDRRLLKKLSRRFQFDLHVLKRLRLKRKIVSSTSVRQLIKKGRLERARYFLGRRVSIFGDVVRGEGRGATLGFPTANIEPRHDVIVPDGIYATETIFAHRRFKSVTYIGTKPTFHPPSQETTGFARGGMRKTCFGAMSLDARGRFAADEPRRSQRRKHFDEGGSIKVPRATPVGFHKKTKRRSIEVFLFGIEKNLYGQTMEVRLIKKIRNDRKFVSPQALAAQIKKDVAVAKKC
jgi:riboflavin kinase/FMN adenylyltransferase